MPRVITASNTQGIAWRTLCVARVASAERGWAATLDRQTALDNTGSDRPLQEAVAPRDKALESRSADTSIPVHNDAPGNALRSRSDARRYGSHAPRNADNSGTPHYSVAAQVARAVLLAVPLSADPGRRATDQRRLPPVAARSRRRDQYPAVSIAPPRHRAAHSPSRISKGSREVTRTDRATYSRSGSPAPVPADCRRA
jgi:hypothetical protein